jgi:hypothetical protein
LGRTRIDDAVIRKQLNDAFVEGVRNHDGTIARCFTPRHGIRVTNGNTITDFVICFACKQVVVFRDDKVNESFLISKSPQATFDEVLKRANVRLAATEDFSNTSLF